MLHPIEPASEHAPPTEVDRSLLCGTCGYELKGLPWTARCPECGAKILASVQMNALRSASPEYLRRLARGLLVIEVAALLRVGSAVGMWFFGGFFFGGAQKKLAGELVSMAIAAAFVLGWWWITTPDLRRNTPEGKLSPRRVARFGACALGAAWWSLDVANILRMKGVGASSYLIPMGVAIWLAAIAAQFFTAIDYLELLAKKGENQRVRRWVSNCRWLIPVGVLAAFVPAVAMYIALLESVKGMIVEHLGNAENAAMEHRVGERGEPEKPSDMQ